jgi:hypothetical protein
MKPIVLLALCLLATLRLLAAPTAVVKVAQPVPLDRPERWPAITAQQAIATPPGESARFTACFDATNLYLLVMVRDDSPLKNSASAFDPAMILKGGDAVGFCFGAAGAQQRILVAKLAGGTTAVGYRPTSVVKKPYTFASPVSTYVMAYVAPLPEVKAAFTPTADGYAVGVAIPWSLLGLKPTDGLEFPFDAQVIFSDAAGTKNIATAWWHSRGNGPVCTVDLPTEARLYPDFWGTARLYTADPGPQVDVEATAAVTVTDPLGVRPVPISFTLPRACKVSLVITDAKGWIVAEPLRAQPMSAGKQTIYWNGRGYRDMPLPPGTYQWRLGYFSGVKSHFFAAVGNSGRPPFPSSDKKGSIGGVHGGPAAVAADAGGIYLLHSGEEGEPGLRKISRTGEVLWTRSLGGFGAGAAVTSDGTSAYMIAGHPELSLIRMDAATGADVRMGASARIKLGDPKLGFSGLAIAGGRAYFSVKSEGRLGVIELATGAALPNIPLEDPSRLCPLDETHLLAISGARVVSIDLATGASTPLLTNLTAPSALTLDAQGNLYVAERGARQTITQYGRDFKPKQTYGVPGGRGATAVPYNPLAFRNICDLSIDADGLLWAVEEGWTAPRRIACLTTDGKWLRDYCGPVYCSSGTVVDLDDARRLYYHLGPYWMKTTVKGSTAHRWQDADWRIDAIFHLSQSGTDEKVTPDLMTGPATPSFAAGITFKGANGKRYFWIDGEQTYTRGNPAALWVWENERWTPAGIQAQLGKKFWADRNGDGRVQDEEYSAAGSPDGGWRWLGRDLVLYGRRGSLKPARIDARGVPDYDGGVFTPYITAAPPAWFKELQGNSEVGVSPPGADGAVYYSANLGNGQGRAFWDRASENKLIKVKDGQVQWWVGHHDASNRGDGDTTFVYNVCGVVDGVIVVCDVANQYHAYTEDGLTLGWLLTDAKGRPRWSDDSYVSAESFSGQFFKDPLTGKYFLACGASESAQLREVTGVAPGEITRLQGTITLTSSMPRTTPLAGGTLIPYATWDCANGRFNGIDGDDWEWWPRNFDAITLRDNGVVIGDVRLRRDAGFLHLFADVLQPAGFRAGESTTAQDKLFGAAEGLELLLGPVNRASPGATAGDTRLFLTARRTEKGTLDAMALACRPASAPIAPEGMRPLLNWGPVGGAPKEPFESATGLRRVPGAKVAIEARPDGQGFRLEAEIPLALFPELAQPSPVTFKRWTDGGNHWIKTYSEERADLAGPLRLNVAAWSTDKANVLRRLPWQADGFMGTDPTVMTPATWGLANGVVSLSWTPQPGATVYRLYRSPTPELATARLIQTITHGTQTSDQPGLGTFYYWLTALDALGESQFVGPSRIAVGASTAEPLIRFSKALAPSLLFPTLPDQHLFPGSTTVLNLTVATKTLTATVTPAGAKATTEALGDNRWRLTLAMPAETAPGTRFVMTLVAAGIATPATFSLTATPVALAGLLTQTGGTLTLDPTAPANAPVTTVSWGGHGGLQTVDLGTRGYILFRHGGYSASVPTRQMLAPFVDTFANGDGFWYGDADGNMQFDLRADDGTVKIGKDAQGHVRFGSVNSNAGVPGKPETYPGTSWTIKMTDTVPHLLTVFSPAKGYRGAKERFTLKSTTGDASPVVVEFDGTQGGAVLQFRLIGSVTLSVQQTVGGMGSSDPGANCAAMLLD